MALFKRNIIFKETPLSEFPSGKFYDLHGFVYRAQLNTELKAKHLDDPAFFMYKLKDVYLDPKTYAIYDMKRQLICHAEIALKGAATKTEVALSSEHFDKCATYDTGYLVGESKNYYHWLINYAPRLFFREELRISSPIVLSSNKSKFVDQTLEALSIEPSALLLIDPQKLTFFKELIVPCFIQNPIHAPTLLSYLRRRLIGWDRISAPDANRRIYLSRQDDLQAKRVNPPRMVLNEKDVTSGLESIGYETIKPGNLSLQDQISLFSESSHIIAPHGAALTNLLFCRPGFSVIEFQHPKAYTAVFWELAKLSGSKRYDVLQTETSEDHLQSVSTPYGYSLTVSLDKLSQTVLKHV